MTFKNKKQLEKEIEELKKEMKEIDYSKQNPDANRKYTELYSKKVLRLNVLNQTNEIIKMINQLPANILNDYKKKIIITKLRGGE